MKLVHPDDALLLIVVWCNNNNMDLRDLWI